MRFQVDQPTHRGHGIVKVTVALTVNCIVVVLCFFDTTKKSFLNFKFKIRQSLSGRLWSPPVLAYHCTKIPYSIGAAKNFRVLNTE